MHHVATRGATCLSLLAALAVASGTAGAAPPTAAPSDAGAGAPPAAFAANPLQGWRVNLVTARAVVKGGDVRNPTDSFTYRGSIHAHATFTTDGPAQAGPSRVEFRWFNGERRVAVKKRDATVSASPHYASVSTAGNALGEGNCRVELHVNGQLVASKRFRVQAM